MDKSYLKERRLELGLTMLDVSKKVGVSEATISRWESGDIDNMKRDKIALLANALNISPLKLLGVDLETSSEETLTDKIKKLPTDKQKEVEKVVDAISSNETIAAHRSDNLMDELPEEARKSIEDFKKFIFEKHGIKYN
ncbi:helix-turn-helix domain-containing protein [Anaerosinus sp.]